MRVRVKICGITRVEDALEAARLGADALGFVFHPASPRFVSTARAAEIVAALPPFVTSVGLFVNADAALVESVLGEIPLDLLQFHGAETPLECARFGKPWMKALAVAPGVDLLQSAVVFRGGRGLLLDAFVPGSHGGTGRTADWTSIPGGMPVPVVLAGGLHPGNVGAAIRAVRPWGVDVSSGVERDKGVKDHKKLAAFMEGVRDADV
jgi:phosphoribosylanthranilate isomerase